MKNVCVLLILASILVGCSKTKQNSAKPSADVASLQLFQQGSEFGYKDMSGTVVLKPQFADAGEFTEGLARVKPDAKGGWGYIDGSGTLVISPQYEAASDFVDGMAIVLSKGQFTYIGLDGGSMGAFAEDDPAKPLSPGDTLYVIHPNGLIARASGSLQGAPVIQVPANKTVLYVHDPQPLRSDAYEGLRGTWILTRYQGKTGYLFDLFLSRYSQALEHQPVEHYRVVASSLSGDAYAVYTLTSFATGGHSIEREGPNWTENDEVVPGATIDQVLARMKLHPVGDLGLLVAFFKGASARTTTEQGDTVTVNVRRDGRGFLENVILTRKGEESSFDATISTHGTHDVEILTTLTTAPAESETQTINQF
jgi:hypothetical protein